MSTLILGGSGFLGKALRGLQTLTPTHEECDLLKPEQFWDYIEEHKPELIINCAGYGVYGEDSKDSVEINLRMFNTLLSTTIPIIHIGSGAEYDKSKPIKDIIEGLPASPPPDKYGFSKYMMSRLSMGRDVTILRPFGVFGPHEDHKRRFITNAIDKVKKKEPIVIYKDMLFDYLWIDDFVKIVKKMAATKPKDYWYNLGGCRIKLSQIAQKISKGKVPVKIMEKGLGYYTCNSDKVQEEYGIKYTSFDEALKVLLKQ